MNDTERCNVCGESGLSLLYNHVDTSNITSICTLVEDSIAVFFCKCCAHLQTIGLSDVSEFYDKNYDLLISSEDEDQIYKIENDIEVFRYDFQVDTLLDKLEIPLGAKILDYGCAKAACLKKLCATRHDIEPFVYDVSKSYIDYWDQFIPKDNQSTYKTESSWNGTIDIITSFFSLEHMSDPNYELASMHDLLGKDGIVYAVVPNVYENAADFIVADHLNHFSEESVTYIFQKNNFDVLEIDSITHNSAFIITARKVHKTTLDISPFFDKSSEIIEKRFGDMVITADYWKNIDRRIHDFEGSNSTLQCAVYGAGFYGTYLGSRLKSWGKVQYVIDQDPFLKGKSFLGKPIISVDKIDDDIKLIYVALNPKKSREIISQIPKLNSKDVKYFFM